MSLFASSTLFLLKEPPFSQTALSEKYQPLNSMGSRPEGYERKSKMGFFQPTIPSPPQGTDLTGQTIVITGANTGLGYEAALQVLQLRASHVIMGVRSVAKGEQARNSLLDDGVVRSLKAPGRVSVLQLDLMDYESTKMFADQVCRLTNRIDVLLLNAGVNLGQYKASPAGHETLMQVNYLSNALLALLLEPVLKKSAAKNTKHIPTIAWVGSIGQHFNSLAKLSPVPSSILSHMSDPKKYAAMSQYPNSKFFVAMFVREFAKRTSETEGVIINNVCPGTCNTEADNKLPFWLRVPMNLHRSVRGRSAVEGGRTLVWASECYGRESHGRFISNNELSPLAKFADTAEGQKFASQLWRETIEECERVAGRSFDQRFRA